MFRPLPSGQFATKSWVMTMFFFLPLVALILSFNGVAAILGVTLYLSGGNPQPAIIILLVFLPCIIFAVSLFLILCTYIDNRHTGELKLPLPSPTYALFTSDRARSFAFASSASFIVCLTLVCLGYYINLAKTILVPREVVQYLSFLVDSCKQAFLLLEEKRQKLTFCLWHYWQKVATSLRKMHFLFPGCPGPSTVS